MTPVGRAILARASTRELQRREVEIMRDPYTRELLWEPTEVLVRHEHDLRSMPVRPLPIRRDDPGWSERLLQSQHEDVQRLIDLNGLPHESDDKARQMRNRNRQLVGIQPLRRMTMYRLVTLQVTYMPSEQRLTWRLRRGAGSHSSDRALHALEEQGLVEVLPLESAQPGAADELCQGILTTLEHHAESFEEVGEDETSPLYSVIASARRQLLIFAPFWSLDRPDTALLDALRRAIRAHPELKVDLVQTSESTALKVQSKQADAKAVREVAHLLDNLRTGAKSRVKVHPPLGRSGLSLALSEGTLAYSRTTLLTDEVRNGSGIRHVRYFELVDHQNLAPIRNQIGAALKQVRSKTA